MSTFWWTFPKLFEINVLRHCDSSCKQQTGSRNACTASLCSAAGDQTGISFVVPRHGGVDSLLDRRANRDLETHTVWDRRLGSAHPLPLNDCPSRLPSAGRVAVRRDKTNRLEAPSVPPADFVLEALRFRWATSGSKHTRIYRVADSSPLRQVERLAVAARDHRGKRQPEAARRSHIGLPLQRESGRNPRRRRG